MVFYIKRVRKIPWRRDRLCTPVFSGFPGASAGRESACSAGDLGLIPRLGRSPGGGNSSGLDSYMDCIVHGVTKSQTWLSNLTAQLFGSLRKSERTIRISFDLFIYKTNAWLQSFKGADTGGEFRLKPVLVDHSENSRALKSYAKSTRPVLYKWNKKPG